MASEMRILLIEDNPADVKITQRALREGRVHIDMHAVHDGTEALDYLYRRGKYAKSDRAPTPDLILLDLNLPGINGREVLDTSKRDPGLKAIPVVVLTTSDSVDDVDAVYRSGGNTFIQKPVEFDRFVEVVTALCRYWGDVAELPAHKS